MQVPINKTQVWPPSSSSSAGHGTIMARAATITIITQFSDLVKNIELVVESVIFVVVRAENRPYNVFITSEKQP